MVGLLRFQILGCLGNHSQYYLVYFLHKVPPAKWFGMNVICWGIAAAAAAGAKGYTTLLVARIFLRMFDATVGPSLMPINSQYYTKPDQAPRFT